MLILRILCGVLLGNTILKPTLSNGAFCNTRARGIMLFQRLSQSLNLSNIMPLGFWYDAIVKPQNFKVDSNFYVKHIHYSNSFNYMHYQNKTAVNSCFIYWFCFEQEIVKTNNRLRSCQLVYNMIYTTIHILLSFIDTGQRAQKSALFSNHTLLYTSVCQILSGWYWFITVNVGPNQHLYIGAYVWVTSSIGSKFYQVAVIYVIIPWSQAHVCFVFTC